MPVIVTKEIKKKRILMAALAILVIAIFSVLYFGGVIGKDSQPAPVEPAVGQSAVVPLAEGTGQEIQTPISDAKLKILEDERFKNLQSPPGVPVKTDTTGKSNPFSE